jgi:hypothetical protein
MIATLTLDKPGKLLMPGPMLREFGIAPSFGMRVGVTPGLIKRLNGPEDELPVITELLPDGTLLLPAGVMPLSVETIVSAIKSDRKV